MKLRFLPWSVVACATLQACTCGAPSDRSSGGEGGSGGEGAGLAAGGSGGAGTAGNGNVGGGSAASGPGGGSAAGGTGGGAAGSAAGGNGAGGGTGTTSGGGPNYFVFASTDTELFTLDPNDPELPLVKVGDFDCVDPANGPFTSMVDIAVDKFQAIWGITGHEVMPLFPAGGSVLCGPATSLTGAGQFSTFYALTFAPGGVIEPQKEVLVAGNTAGELWSIGDDGSVTLRGNFGTVPDDDGNGNPYPAQNVGQKWELSGDIVFLANDGAPVGFATVRDCPNPPSPSGCSKTDTLIEIDMAKLSSPTPGNVTKAVRGKILKKIGCGADGVVAGSMFGIAAWNENVFGFSRTGSLVKVETADGGGCLVKNYPTHEFSGAGVTTLAPVVVPPLQ